ncbi:MAG: TVP38/TMEM64 family protein [Alphaproteobacteria bacterium]|nr:TVP38/TMEM64 family protein [Alphaproteobacteria bacterium]MBT4085648.1 TVP38/TMEM64 family protein [Alphaproteobacteria bacterium]MBT4542722.1 TVP38/TMEM64 family protein [Alphaproteobacteria bacterium]MBT7745872.1 TVP38/TMEM64 family protein [Alphaproteobacteria bacterium]
MKYTGFLRLVVLVSLGAAMIWIWSMRDMFDSQTMEAQISEFGMWAPIVFIAAYTIAVPLCLPGSLITLLAGALFGPVFGGIYALLGATIGATLSFLIARYIAGDLATSKFGGKLGHIKEGVDAEGWRFVALVRLVPLFPFNILNYLMGLTAIPLKHYVLASFICMAPGTGAYAYAGYAGREAATGGQDFVFKIVTALSILAAVALMPLIIKRWRAHFAEKPPASS